MYDRNNNLIPFQESDLLYTKDRLGLRYLYDNGRLIMMSEPGNHLTNLTRILVDKLLDKYLADDEEFELYQSVWMANQS
jgi:hypothetical protein